MVGTLSERVKERMVAMQLKNAQLATLCSVKPPTSFNWASGKTKSIKGEPLLKAAKALGVTPEWLATGRGQKFPADAPPEAESTSFAVSEKATASYFDPATSKAARAHHLLNDLPAEALPEAITLLEWLVEKHKKPASGGGPGAPLQPAMQA